MGTMQIFDMCAVMLLLVEESEGEFLRIYYLSLCCGFGCIIMMKHEYMCYLLYRVEENNTFGGDKEGSKLRVVRCGTHAWKCLGFTNFSIKSCTRGRYCN
jgi:hypothetical protein